MRVAVLTASYPVPSETFVRRHVQAFDADVLAPYPGIGPPLSPEERARLWSLDRRARLPLSKRLLRRVRALRPGFHLPRWPEEMEPIWERFLAQRRPEVVLAEFAPNALAALTYLRQSALPLVTHFHGYDASALLRHRAYRKSLADLFRQSGAVVAVSQHMAQALARQGCPAEKLHVIPCGASVSEFTPPSARATDCCRFVCVGRLVEIKAPLLVLKAFRHCLQRTRVHCELVFAGDGPLLMAVRQRIAQLSLEAKVRLTGFLPHPEVPALLRESNVFLQHSITTADGAVEGWGVALAEASASGLPSVTTRSGGIPDQVVDGVTGYLVEERDWQAMGDRMAQLAEAPALRHQMGLAARAHIENVGNTERQLIKLREVLEIAAGLRGPQRALAGRSKM